MENKQKNGLFRSQFNSIQICDNDPSILKGKVIVHGFDESWNGQVITEEICAENMNTLIGKRIVCKYIPAEDNGGVDAIGSHEEKEGKNRDGDPIIVTDTIAIGFIENAYIDDYTNEVGITKRVLWADVVLWNDDKYANIVGLLQEWLSRNIKIHMSVEYLYCNYNVIEGVEFIQSPIIYVSHALLNSEQRGDCAEILPAYDEAQLKSLSLNEKEQWNKAISQLIKSQNWSNIDININKNIKNSKEDDKMAENLLYKALCELSHGDIREKIMTALSKTMTAEEFNYVWVSNYGIYDTYFVYENYENNKYVYYKVPYTKTETEVTVDLTNKVLVERDEVWIEVSAVQASINELNTKIVERDNTITLLNETVANLTSENTEASNKLIVATDSIAELSKQVNEMKPVVEKFNKEKYDETLNAQKAKYEEKFIALNAKDKYESKEVQELIVKSLNDEKAALSLNLMLVDLVKPIEKKDNKVPIEPAKSLNNLIETQDDFEKRYFV